jgi:glycosyltransferase involved in cell wall biosynthesis
MKIGGLRTHYLGPDNTERLSSVDAWRIDLPLRYVKSHSDHEVIFYNKIVEKGEQPDIAWEKFNDYDLIWTSYFSTPKAYAYLKAASELYGFAVVMDVDDNFYDVDEMAPAYIRYHPGSKDLKNITTILCDVDYVTTSTNHLASVVARYRTKPIIVLPNAIDPLAYKYDPAKVPDNGKRIVVGYQGSATHYGDLVDTGVLYALKRIVNKYPQVDIHIMGCIIDDFKKFLPEKRLKFIGGDPDHRGWRKKWQELDFDIGLAPLKYSSFNRSKSSIKYQEYGLRKIPGLYSNIDPYLCVKENETGFLFDDEESFYEKLTWLIENKKLRQIIGDNARKDVLENHSIRKGGKLWLDLVNSIL